jgi:hypothetical protein
MSANVVVSSLHNLACFAFSLGHRRIICKIASIFSLRPFYPATIAKGISKIR